MAAVSGSTDFTQFTPHGTPGASTFDSTAANLMGQANIRNDATYNMGKNQTTYLKEQLPQLQSSISASGNYYSGARKQAVGNQERHYLDSQYDILHGAHNALDSLVMQQAYAATGLII